VIRDRLGEDTYQQVFLLILSALQEHGLLKGRNIGIDASVIEANAALKSLVNRIVWDDSKTGSPLSSTNADRNAISAPVSFLTAVANGYALDISSVTPLSTNGGQLPWRAAR
jgi:hypothetical protein